MIKFINTNHGVLVGKRQDGAKDRMMGLVALPTAIGKVIAVAGC